MAVALCASMVARRMLTAIAVASCVAAIASAAWLGWEPGPTPEESAPPGKGSAQDATVPRLTTSSAAEGVPGLAGRARIDGPPARLAHLRVRAVDTAGAPVPGARVRLRPWRAGPEGAPVEATTDALGTCTLACPTPDSRAALLVTAPGGAFAYRPGVGTEGSITVILAHGATLHVAVTDEGTPVSQATCTLRFPDSLGVRTASTGARGTATFDGLPCGSLDLEPTASPRMPVPRLEVRRGARLIAVARCPALEAGASYTLEVELGAEVRVRIAVVDETDEAIGGAHVELRAGDDLVLATSTTDARGRVTLGGARYATGPWLVVVTAPGFAPAEDALADPEAGTLVRDRVRLERRRGPPLRGGVRDERGRPLAGLCVWPAEAAAEASGMRTRRAAWTDADGRFGPLWGFEAHTEPGRRRFTVDTIGDPYDVVGWVRAEGDERVVDLTVPRTALGRRVAGRVTAPDGTPVAGAFVRYEEQSGRLARNREAPPVSTQGVTRTDADGRFLLYVPPYFRSCTHVRGAGSIVATAPGFADARAQLPRSTAPVLLALELPPARALTGEVRLSDGTPAARVYVYARTSQDPPHEGGPRAARPREYPDEEPGGDVLAEALTDEAGRYVLPHVPADRAVDVHAQCVIRRMGGGRDRWRAWAYVPPDGGETILSLPASRAELWPLYAGEGARTVRLRLTDPQGAPLGGLTGHVVCRGLDRAMSGSFGEGVIGLDGWPAGPLEIEVDSAAWGTTNRSLELPAGTGDVELSVALAEGPQVRARVRLPPGFVAEDLTLTLQRDLDEETVRPIALGEDDLRVARNVAPGRWHLAVADVGGAELVVVEPAEVIVAGDFVDLAVVVAPGTWLKVTARWPWGLDAAGSKNDEDGLTFRVADAQGRLRAWRTFVTSDDDVGWTAGYDDVLLPPGRWRVGVYLGARLLGERFVDLGAAPVTAHFDLEAPRRPDR